MWEKISKDRIQLKRAGFFVIKPESEGRKPVPLFCPVCDEQMKNTYDAHCFRKFECCGTCATYHAEPNKEQWMNGWRPDLCKGK